MTHPRPAAPDNGPSSVIGPDRGPINPSPTAELTALAAQLSHLTARLNDIDARTTTLSGTLTSRVLPELAQLRTTTDDQITQLRQVLDTTARSGGPPDWATMDAERAAATWQDLAHWIEHTLVPWHEITRDQLPDCWALHRPAVIELAWLQHTHRAAHRPDAEPHLTAEWHTRWKPAALHAIHDAIPRRGARTCGPGHHLTDQSERVLHRPAGTAPVRLPVEPVASPTEQLAQRHHWQHFYEQGVKADLASR